MKAPPHHHAFRAYLALGLVLALAGAVWWLLLWDGVAQLPSYMGRWLSSLVEVLS